MDRSLEMYYFSNTKFGLTKLLTVDKVWISRVPMVGDQCSANLTHKFKWRSNELAFLTGLSGAGRSECGCMWFPLQFVIARYRIKRYCVLG